jgi:5'-3' exonuclease
MDNGIMYSLINTMRKAGVKPITVWDVKGERPWKMKEHARRELSRQLSMSRVLHEDQRQVRLDKIRRLLGNVPRLQKEASRQSVRFSRLLDNVITLR